MRLVLLLLLTVGFSLSEVLWKPHQQYVYGIYSRTLSALPDLKEQYVGVITKGELVLHVKAPNRVVGTLVNCVYAHYHDILENGIDTEIPDDVLNYQPSELNNKPFVLEINNGLIQNVLVDQMMTNDQVNQLKAILSQLQIDVNGQHLIKSRINHLPQVQGKPKGIFKVMEPTVTGLCETVYDVNPVQDFQVGHIIPDWTHYKNIDILTQINQYKVQNQQQQQQPWQKQTWNEQNNEEPWQGKVQEQTWQGQQWEGQPRQVKVQGQTNEQPWQGKVQGQMWQEQTHEEQPWQEQGKEEQWQGKVQEQTWQGQPRQVKVQGQTNEQPWQGKIQGQMWQEQTHEEQPWQEQGKEEQWQGKVQGQTWKAQQWEGQPRQGQTKEQKWQGQQYSEQVQSEEQPTEVVDGSFFEIVKTINYSNCVQQRGYHHGIRSSINIEPLSNKVGDFLTKSTVTKITAYGRWNDFIVNDVITTNRVSVSPNLYQEQKLEVVSQIQMKLLQIKQITTMLEEPKQVVNVGNLVYTYNLPSDKTNKIRVHDVAPEEQIKFGENVQGKYPQHFSSEQNEQLDSEEVHYQKIKNIELSSHQPTPNLHAVPEIPLLHITVGNKGSGIHVDPKINIENEVNKLVKEITQDVLVHYEIMDHNTLEKFDVLCDLVRVLNQQQILNIHKQLRSVFGTETEQNLFNLIQIKVYRDAVAQAGTGPAVFAVCKWIVDRHVKGIEARDLIQDTCKSLQTPNEEIIKVIFNLVKNDEIKRQKQLHSTVLLSFTKLLQRAQVYRVEERNRFPVYVFGQFHKQLEQIVVNEVIPYLAQCIQQAINVKDDQSTLLHLRALGNLAHPQVLNVYQHLLENGAKLTQFQRTALVLSLDKLAKFNPTLTRHVLFNIFANVAEAPQTRSVAVLLLMRTNPSVQMLQRLAQATHDDPSHAVRSIIKSAIITASELKSKIFQHLSDNCKAVRNILTQHHFGDLYSKTYIRDYVAKEMNLIYSHQLTHIIGEDNVIPQITHFEAHNHLGGFSEKIAELHAMVSTVEELVKLLPSCKKGFCTKPKTYYQSIGQQQPQEQFVPQHGIYEQQLHQERENLGQIDVTKQLNIEQEVAKRLEGQLRIHFLGRNGYFSFDEKTLKQLPQTLVSTLSVFNQGEKLDYNKFHLSKQITVAFPLATGYPFVYTFRQPQLLQTIGQVQIKTVPDLAQNPTLETIQNIETVTVNANVHFVYSSNQIGQAGFFTPCNRQRYVAGYVRKVFSHIPLSVKFDVDLKTGNVNLKVTPIDTKKDFKLLQSGAWPFTMSKDVFDLSTAAETKDMKVIQTRKPQVYNRVFGEKTAGMVFQLQAQHQFKGEHYKRLEKALWKQGLLSLINVPLSYHHLWQKFMQNEGQSILSLLPFSFQQRMGGNYFNHVFSNLLSIPLANDVDMNRYIKSEGFLSFFTLPFATKQTLEETVKGEDILTLGQLPWPIKSLDHYHYNIKYDAARSVNHVIKCSLKIDTLHNVNEAVRTVSNRVQGPSTVDEEKLAYPTTFTADSEQRRVQFLENAATGMKQASAIVLDASIVFDGQNKAEYVVTIAHGESPVDEKDRLLVFVNSNGVQKTENKQVCISYLGKSQKTPSLSFEQALQKTVKTSARVQVAYGDNCQNTKSHVLVNINLEQTPEYKQMVKNSQTGQRCIHELKRGNKQLPGCIDATYQANLLDTVTINVDLKNPVQQINDVVYACLNTLRTVSIWNLQHEVVNQNPNPNKISVVLKFKPIMNNEDKHKTEQTIGMDNVDIMLDSGTVKQIFTNVHVNKILRPLLSVHPKLDIDDRYIRNALNNGHICTVDQNKIFTFDNNLVQHNIGKCWHVMVHHTKLQSRLGKLDLTNQIVQQKDVTVLVRQANTLNQKEIMITCKSSTGVNHVVHLVPNGPKIQIKIDGQEQNITPDQYVAVFDEQQDRKRQKPLIRIQRLWENEVQVQIRGKQMKIYFDGFVVRVHADPAVYRKNVHGLCGAFTGEKVRDLVTPRQCVVNKHSLFTSAWALGDTCSKEVQQAKSFLQHVKCHKVRYTTGNILQNWNFVPQEQQVWPYSQSNFQSIEQLKQQKIGYGNQWNVGNYQNYQNVNSQVETSQELFKQQQPQMQQQQQQQWVQSGKKQSSEELNPTQHQQFVHKSSQQTHQLGLGVGRSSEEQQEHKIASGEQNVSGETTQLFGKQTKCLLKKHIKLIYEGNQVCFSKQLINVCPVDCTQTQTKEIEVDVHCRDNTDPVTKLWIQQIHKGEYPDLSTKQITKMIKVNVPIVCVH